MGKAQELERCHKCNVSRGPGMPCKCTTIPSLPDRAVFVRDMLAELYRQGKDPLVRFVDKWQPEIDGAEGLAAFCTATREYLEKIQTLEFSGRQAAGPCTPRRQRLELQELLTVAQEELRFMAWPKPVLTELTPCCGRPKDKCHRVTDKVRPLLERNCNSTPKNMLAAKPEHNGKLIGGSFAYEKKLSATEVRQLELHIDPARRNGKTEQMRAALDLAMRAESELELVRMWESRQFVALSYHEYQLSKNALYSNRAKHEWSALAEGKAMTVNGDVHSFTRCRSSLDLLRMHRRLFVVWAECGAEHYMLWSSIDPMTEPALVQLRQLPSFK